jgi:hypothetical protein
MGDARPTLAGTAIGGECNLVILDAGDVLHDAFAVRGPPARPTTSALKEENFRMVATPFLATLSVLSNDNSKAHACPPIAVLAGYAKSEHSLAKFVTRSRSRAGSDFDTTRTNTNGLRRHYSFIRTII